MGSEGSTTMSEGGNERWVPEDATPTVNVVFVSPDPARTAPYGRQIERRTSLAHQSRVCGPSEHWRRTEEPALVECESFSLTS